MSSTTAQLKLLVNLARIDGRMLELEKEYIRTIGIANGLSENEMDVLLSQSHETIIPEGLTQDQKFDYIFSLVQLMKIDERLYSKEIKYCSQVAANLGYQQEVMFELMLKVSASMKKGEVESLRELVSTYLN